MTLGGILFRPANTSKPQPAIIVLHGWAQPGVAGAPRVEGTARRLAERGYVALALSMRGWPPSSGWDDCGTAQPDDVAKAADWLATLPGVDGDSIGVLGFSLGGQVALLSATRSVRIKAIVAYFPITDIQRWAPYDEQQGNSLLLCSASVRNQQSKFAGSSCKPDSCLGPADSRRP